MDAKSNISKAMGIATSSYSHETTLARGQIHATVAVGQLLTEILDRMPEKPMQVISTPPAPTVEDTPQVKPLSDIPVRFRCASWDEDYVDVNYVPLTGRVGLMAHDGPDENTEIYLSREDAIALAKSILATV